MTAPTWPVVTCTACGATGPGRPKAGLCKRCYARAQHPVQPRPGCGQTRRHLAAGLCAPCYRLSRTRLLGEAHATGGDPLQLTRLFGISDPTAIRYCAELDQIATPSAGACSVNVSPTG